MKILIVEDDDRISIPLKEELQHQNYVVDLAFDGSQGLEMA
ncbi:DNA-binding response regulator, partial [cyanobacterium TDX16]